MQKRASTVPGLSAEENARQIKQGLQVREITNTFSRDKNKQYWKRKTLLVHDLASGVLNDENVSRIGWVPILLTIITKEQELDMDRKTYQLELVKQAQRGDKESLGLLAEQARIRLHTYVYRLTQQEELTQEIVQESLVEMCKVLGKLKKDDRFWPWLYGIAVNKLRRYYRTERTQRRLSTASAEYRDSIRSRRDGFEDLVGDELKHIIAKAMMKLKARHKAVLVMRCYDEMAYSDIAESMGCSEFNTRMLFLRAKRALQKELSRYKMKSQFC